MTTICGARQLGRTCEWDRPAHLVLCRVHRTRVRRRRRGRGRHNAAACRDERGSRRCFVQVHRGSSAERGHTQLGCRDGRGEQDGAGHGLAPPGALIVYGSGRVLLTLGDRAPRVARAAPRITMLSHVSAADKYWRVGGVHSESSFTA